MSGRSHLVCTEDPNLPANTDLQTKIKNQTQLQEGFHKPLGNKYFLLVDQQPIDFTATDTTTATIYGNIHFYHDKMVSLSS